MNVFSSLSRTARILAAFLSVSLAAAPTASPAAGLPTMEDPTRGQGSGILQTLQNYGYDIVMLVALLVVASMFVGVCYPKFISGGSKSEVLWYFSHVSC